MKAILAASILLPAATFWMVTRSGHAEIDPNTGIKKRLRDFIELAESIDFDANVESQVEFVPTDYRTQPDERKLLYRVGREQVLAARDSARTLLNELV